MFDWYNGKICEDKCWEFEEKYSFSYNSILFALQNNFENFCLACNVLAYYGYLPERKTKNLSYEEKSSLVKIANKIAREKVGENFSTLFDGIVRKSCQELWDGDEFYKLFAYDIPPYYVMSCVKASVYMIDMIKNPKTIERTIEISSMVCNPPYWELYKSNTLDRDFNRQNEIREKECNGWRKIAENLYNRQFKEVYDFISKCDEERLR